MEVKVKISRTIITIFFTIVLVTIIININGCNAVGGFGKDLTEWSGTDDKRDKQED